MLFNLARSNFKRSLKDYAIYFLTLLFGVCLFYVFNSMDSQQVMLALNESQKEIIQTFIRMMNGVSVFVAVILGLLIVYANRFLIKRRKKELGVYLLLGMEKRDVAFILMTETLLIGVFALVAGLAAGVFISQGLAVFTAYLFEVKIEAFRFVFSQVALVKTLLYFGIIFVTVIIFNIIWISKNKLVDLLLASRKNEVLKVKRLELTVVLFILSVICLGAAYKLLWPDGYIEVNTKFWLCIGLGITGTFLFFFSLSGFLLRIVKMAKGVYYRGINMFVLRQINAKITTTFISMTVLCLLLLLGIGTLALGMGLAEVTQDELDEKYPVDATVVATFSGDTVKHNKKQVEEFELFDYMKRLGMPADEIVEQINRLDYYMESKNSAETRVDDRDISYEPFIYIPLSQFNKEMELRGEQPVALESGQALLNILYKEGREGFEDYIETYGSVRVFGKELEILKNTTEYMLGVASNYSDTVLIVPDEAITSDYIYSTMYNIIYKGDKEYADKIIWDNDFSLYTIYLDILGDETGGGGNVGTKIHSMEMNIGNKVLMTYLALYIGLIFFITSAAVLALQQLSESSDNIERYALLRKLGVEEREINHSLGVQVLIYFMIPLSLTLVHAYVAVNKVNVFLQAAGSLDVLSNTLYWGGILAFIYGLYMLATYWGGKVMIRER